MLETCPRTCFVSRRVSPQISRTKRPIYLKQYRSAPRISGLILQVAREKALFSDLKFHPFLMINCKAKRNFIKNKCVIYEDSTRYLTNAPLYEENHRKKF